MPLLWQRTSSPLKCFFCQATQPAASQQPGQAAHRFVCSQCGSYNALNAAGQPLDQPEPLYSDASITANQAAFSKRASPLKAAQLTRLSGEIPFCTSCLRNQSLQHALLASFLDDDEAENDPTTQDRLQLYKESLDSRYPLLCAECAPKIQRELVLRNSKARAAILNQAVRQSAASPRSERQVRGRDVRATWKWQLQTAAWLGKGLLWAALQAWTLLYYAKLIQRPSTTEPSVRALCTCCLAFPISFWQPLWHHHRQAARTAPDARMVVIHGRGLWLAACAWAYLLRIAVVLAILTLHLPAQAIVRLGWAAVLLATSPLLAAGSRLQIRRQSLPFKSSHADTLHPAMIAAPPQHHQQIAQQHPTPEPASGPHPLFGDWQVASKSRMGSSTPMEVDETFGPKENLGDAGMHRTELEDLLGSADLLAQARVSDSNAGKQRMSSLFRRRPG